MGKQEQYEEDKMAAAFAARNPPLYLASAKIEHRQAQPSA
jgi:hypothetical protein